jgi:4-hydroxybenzoate polyprenyltransferase
MNIKKVLALIQLLRPQQWIKNAFVWTGFLFSQGWHQQGLVTKVILVTIAFCFISSAIYIFNDITDRNCDRLHPYKKNRPLASNRIPFLLAGITGILIASIGFSIGFYISLQTVYLLDMYVLINIAYSLYLKNIIILDVILIAAGFMLRILVGTLGIGIPPSWWLLICGTLLAILLGFIKRRAEVLLLKESEYSHRKVLQHYSKRLLNIAINTTAMGVIISYSIYAIYQDYQYHHGLLKLIYTLPLVLLGIKRYLYLLQSEKYPGAGIDVARDLFNDFPLLATITGWLLLTIAVLNTN